MKLKKKEGHNVVLLRRGIKIPMGGDTETKYGAVTKGKAIQRLSSPVHPFYIQLLNLDTIVDANKCLLKGDCLLRGYARA